MSELTLYDAVLRLGQVIEPEVLRELEARYDRLVATHTAPPSSPFTGVSGTEQSVIARELDKVEAAERQAEAVVEEFPAAEAALAQANKAASGKWVLLAVIVIIIAAVLIGQGI